jgi:hypothetical protein
VSADEPTSPTGTPAALQRTHPHDPQVEVIGQAFHAVAGVVMNPLDASDLLYRGWTSASLHELRRLAQHALDADSAILAHYASATAGQQTPEQRSQRIARGLYDFATKSARAYARYGPRCDHLTRATALPYALAWATVLVSEPVVGAVTRLAYSPSAIGMPDGWLTPRPETAPWAWSAGFTADEAATLPTSLTAANLQAMGVLRGYRFPSLDSDLSGTSE